MSAPSYTLLGVKKGGLLAVMLKYLKCRGDVKDKSKGDSVTPQGSCFDSFSRLIVLRFLSLGAQFLCNRFRFINCDFIDG